MSILFPKKMLFALDTVFNSKNPIPLMFIAPNRRVNDRPIWLFELIIYVLGLRLIIKLPALMNSRAVQCGGAGGGQRL